MPKVFISHSSADEAISQKITEQLKQDGISVWVDSESLLAGDDLTDKISQALEECEILILVWSKSAIQSHYVGLEWKSAINLKKKIIPCVLDGSKLPAILTNYVFIDFKNFNLGYQRLLGALGIKGLKNLECLNGVAQNVKIQKVGIENSQKKKLFLYFFFVMIIIIGIYILWNMGSVRMESEKQIKGIKFIFINGGIFNMGDNIGDGDYDERPEHSVRLSNFYMSETEITVEQFRKFVEAKDYQTEAERIGYAWVWSGSEWEKIDGTSWRKPGFPQNESHPVVCVTWNDAAEFCKWIGCRLPTEAEWEYACRSGTITPFNTGFNLYTVQANYNGNFPYKNYPKGFYINQTTPVASYPPNSWGLYDMHGNVDEWCADWYNAEYFTECKKMGIIEDPIGPELGSDRIIRGGSWYGIAAYCRSADRGHVAPNHCTNAFGFRLVFVP